MIDPRELRTVTAFAELADDELRWLAQHCEEHAYEPGDVLRHEGERIDTMYVVLEGELRYRREKGTPDDRSMIRRAGDITGLLPLSRMTHTPVTLRAVTHLRTAEFPAELFPAMLERIPGLQLPLASVMVERAREFTRHDAQREKLISLGKLSAGLAHELNNPASAIQQRTETLARRLDELSAMALRGLDPGAAETLTARVHGTAGGASTDEPPPILDALERSDAEDAVTSWLEAQGVPGPRAAAETLVTAGLSTENLEQLIDGLPEDAVSASLEWLTTTLALRRLVSDISDATNRIVELIAAVKIYSNMDRTSRNQDIDLHEGIRSTLAMLSHKLRSKRAVLRTDFDPRTPRVFANPAELNQVWTNLLDNAIDAIAEGGEITVRTSGTAGRAVVTILDDGPGIPDEIQARIFEPFYTTKDVGEGTGLGLDVARRIVERHRGDVSVESEPGRTRFEVRLPPSEGAATR